MAERAEDIDASGVFNAFPAALEDRFHQPYREALVPGLHEILKLRAPGLRGCALSGDRLYERLAGAMHCSRGNDFSIAKMPKIGGRLGIGAARDAKNPKKTDKRGWWYCIL